MREREIEIFPSPKSGARGLGEQALHSEQTNIKFKRREAPLARWSRVAGPQISAGGGG